jgi:hypothetical protein
MDKRVAQHILKWHYESELNFIRLLSFINDNDIPIVDSKLINAIGMATYYKIHLDLDNLNFQLPLLRYFIILHEIGHYKRLHKKGLEFHLHKLSSSNVNMLYKHLLNEELIADNYAMFTFRRLTGAEYPYEMTQQLKEYENKVKYMDTANSFIGKLENNEDSYKSMINQYIIK